MVGHGGGRVGGGRQGGGGEGTRQGFKDQSDKMSRVYPQVGQRGGGGGSVSHQDEFVSFFPLEYRDSKLNFYKLACLLKALWVYLTNYDEEGPYFFLFPPLPSV